jgi:hypothetical protein
MVMKMGGWGSANIFDMVFQGVLALFIPPPPTRTHPMNFFTASLNDLSFSITEWGVGHYFSHTDVLKCRHLHLLSHRLHMCSIDVCVHMLQQEHRILRYLRRKGNMPVQDTGQVLMAWTRINACS